MCRVSSNSRRVVPEANVFATRFYKTCLAGGATGIEAEFCNSESAVCGSVKLGEPVWLTVRGFQTPWQHIQLYCLLLFTSCETTKPLSTSPVIARGHICISQSQRKRDTSLLSFLNFIHGQISPLLNTAGKNPEFKAT